LRWHGLPAAESAAAIVSLLGILATMTMLLLTRGFGLEERSPETARDAGGIAAAA
jgi:hypothetical protein